MNDFLNANHVALTAFKDMSRAIGARADYVQGGGGNTSLKLPDGLMAIKASGFCLSDIDVDKAYAVLDYKAVSSFYYDNQPSDFEDVEKSGAARVKESVKAIEGIEQLRPSVEAGFHSLLPEFVAHSHSVYANLAACAVNGLEIANKAFEGADYSFGFVPYTDPGARLSFSIRDEIKRVTDNTGKPPAVILMQNHGLIAAAPTADEALRIHADANERLAAAFGLKGDSFPKPRVKPAGEGLFVSDTPYLIEKLKGGKYGVNRLLLEPLYPDQMVFLTGTLTADAKPDEDGCVISESGEVLYRMKEDKARIIEETLTAVVFICENIEAKGYALSTMGEAAKQFIANWESEKYRKSLAGKAK